MHHSNPLPGLAAIGAVAALGLAACGSSIVGNAGGSGAATTTTATAGTGGTTSTTSSGSMTSTSSGSMTSTSSGSMTSTSSGSMTSTSSGSMTSTSSGSSGAACSGFACSPTAACGAVDDCCIGLVDNAGLSTFGLRIAQLEASKPAALATGAVATVIAGDVQPNQAACNLTGTGTFSWLLQLDTAASTLETGGALPVADPAQGYAFVDAMVTQGSETFHVQPVVFQDVTIAPDGFLSTMPLSGKLYMPMYLSATDPTQVIILPLTLPSVASTLSTDHDCIGSYNAPGLQPAMNCMASEALSAFTSGGTIVGDITIADADAVDISLLSESLCVLIAGAAYSDDAQPVAHCKKDASGAYLVTGDGCSTPGGSCADAWTFEAGFAASSIKINN